MPSSAAERNSQNTIPLFLYGTLRPGGARHDLVAPYLVTTEPARVCGRLYHVPAGYPALEVSEKLVLGHGSDSASQDAELARSLPAPTKTTVAGDWDWVEGDWVTLATPEFSLPPIDDYEDFRPDAPSLYDRVLLAVETATGTRLAWTYVKAPAPEDIRLRSGRWKSPTE